MSEVPVLSGVLSLAATIACSLHQHVGFLHLVEHAPPVHRRADPHREFDSPPTTPTAIHLSKTTIEKT